MASHQLIGLRIEVTFHWGFWVRAPFTSRYQESLTIPPPTTLIGALAEPLIQLGFLKGVRGETIKTDLGVSSAASLLDSIIPTASFCFDGTQNGFAYEDINRYITLHYQQKAKDPSGIRRYLPQYRTGALRVGKVSMPSGRGIACYIIDADAAHGIFSDDPERSLLQAAYNITRLGSKESIVSVESAEIIPNPTTLKPPLEIKTRYYFPYRLAEVTSEPSDFYIERFWRGGWSRRDKPEFEDYVIPGTRVPISSKTIRVRILRGYVVKLRDEEVLCF